MKLLQARTQAIAGQPVDVGKIETELPFNVDTDAPDATGAEPYELLARVFAHVGHRIPGVKRIERRLEGKQLSSGLASDMLALGAQLWARNRPVVEKLAADAVEKAQAQAQAKRASKNTNGTGQPAHVPDPEVVRP